MKIKQCKTPCQKYKEEKFYDHIRWQGKNIWQNPTPIQQTQNRREPPQPGKDNLQKGTANILFKGEKLGTLPLRSETRQWVLLSPFLSNIELEFLPNIIRQEREIKGQRLEIKLFLFVDAMVVYVENPKDSIRRNF